MIRNASFDCSDPGSNVIPWSRAPELAIAYAGKASWHSRSVRASLNASHPSAVGRVTPAGVVTEFDMPALNAGATRLTAGSDRCPPRRLTNRLWIAEGGANKVAYLSFR